MKWYQRMLNSHRLTTIKKLREECPFPAVNQAPITNEVPDLLGVKEAVKKYQRAPTFFTSDFQLRQHDRAIWNGCPAELRLFVWKYMRALRKRGLPFYIHTCYRTPELQHQLKQQGNSTLSRGPHQRSCAVDIVSSIDHWDIPKDLWLYVGSLGQTIAEGTHFGTGLDGKPLKIQWGGDWDGDGIPVTEDTDERLWDPAHWQLSDWRKRPVEKLSDAPLKLIPYGDTMRFG